MARAHRVRGFDAKQHVCIHSSSSGHSASVHRLPLAYSPTSHPVTRDVAGGLAAHVAHVYIAISALDQRNCLQEVHKIVDGPRHK